MWFSTPADLAHQRRRNTIAGPEAPAPLRYTRCWGDPAGPGRRPARCRRPPAPRSNGCTRLAASSPASTGGTHRRTGRQLWCVRLRRGARLINRGEARHTAPIHLRQGPLASFAVQASPSATRAPHAITGACQTRDPDFGPARRKPTELRVAAPPAAGRPCPPVMTGAARCEVATVAGRRRRRRRRETRPRAARRSSPRPGSHDGTPRCPSGTPR